MWEDASLSDLGTVERGRSRHRPRNDPALYGGPYPFFQTGDVKAANFWLRNHSATYNEAGLAQSRLWEPGTLCITIAANIAESAILAVQGCFPDSVVGFVPKPGTGDVKFVKYMLDFTKSRMQAVSQGTTQDNLSLDKLLRFRFRCPPYHEQVRIASILSAYDDLIENNTRRIQILEEMAQAIYREWFVAFRFPGHENVRMVDSELGPIPEAWSLGTLSDLLVLQRGFDLPRQKRASGPIPVVAATGVHGTHSTAAVHGPGVVTGRSGSLGTVLYLSSDFWPLNTTLWVKEFRVATPELAYFTLKAMALEEFNSGAAVPTLNRNDIAGHPVPVPPSSLVDKFSSAARDMFRLAENLARSTDVLRATRDLLLPRLISGEIDVSKLDLGSAEPAA